MQPEGWHGWDAYAAFYDWENARTLGRRDVPFWRRLAARAGGPVLELGCGTGRLTIFDETYIERRGRRRRVRRFQLVFRTLSVPEMTERLERAGFRIDAVLGDYAGAPWQPRADVWIILATRRDRAFHRTRLRAAA